MSSHGNMVTAKDDIAVDVHRTSADQVWEIFLQAMVSNGSS
jgi:hypothetical protein